jgi:hypothetical protein
MDLQGEQQYRLPASHQDFSVVGSPKGNLNAGFMMNQKIRRSNIVFNQRNEHGAT